MKPRLALLLLLTLASCGGFPQPFYGNPGRAGARLSLPPPPRLVVLAPATALLTTRDATLFAADLAGALADRDVPAVAAAQARADWRLAITAELQPGTGGGQVIPTYTVQNPKGAGQGSTSGPAISAQTWSLAAPTALRLVAQRDAPAIATLLDTIKAQVQQSDPNSLVNRPVRIALAPVTGAPGDGNTSLHAQIAHAFTDLGILIATAREPADFQVAGAVVVAPGPPGQSRIEIQWTVRDPYGREAGHLLQMNDIPQGSLDRYWGEVAAAVGQEAASGVREVILNQTAHHRIGSTPPPAAANAAPS